VGKLTHNRSRKLTTFQQTVIDRNGMFLAISSAELPTVTMTVANHR